MASSGNWLTDGLSRLQHGVDPFTAFFTPAPKASSAMGKNTYYAPDADPNPPAAVTGAAPPPTPPNTGNAAGGGGSYDANYDPGLISQARGQVNPLLATLHQLYGDLNTQIDKYGTDKRTQIDDNYNTGLTNNTNSYNKAYNTTDGIFTARGAGDSSYLGNAQQDNKNDLTASNKNLENSYNSNLEQLASVLTQEKAVVADEPKYNLADYQDVDSLTSLRDALNDHIGNLKGEQTKLLTGGELKGKLDAIAPGKSTLDTTLKARIDSLAGSGASPEAIYGLGQSYIDGAGLGKGDKDKWTTYLSTVLSGSKKAS